MYCADLNLEVQNCIWYFKSTDEIGFQTSEELTLCSLSNS